MAFSKAQWSLVRKIKKMLQDTRRTKSKIVTLIQEREDFEKCKAEVEVSNPHEYDLLLALTAKLHQISTKIKEEEQRLGAVYKNGRFLGAELDRLENFPSKPLAFRVEEGVGCWADFYSLATMWIKFVLCTGTLDLSFGPDDSDRSDRLSLDTDLDRPHSSHLLRFRVGPARAYISTGKLVSSRRLTPVHAPHLPDMASKKGPAVKCQVEYSRRPQDRCPAAMISILMSLDSLMKSTHHDLGASAEQVSSRLLSLWKRSSFPVSKKSFSATPQREILSSDLSSNAFPDSNAQLDGPRLPKEDDNGDLVLFTGYCMDSCGSDGLFPLQ